MLKLEDEVQPEYKDIKKSPCGEAGPHTQRLEEPETAGFACLFTAEAHIGTPTKAFRKSASGQSLARGTPEASGLPPAGPLLYGWSLAEEKSTFHFQMNALSL